MKLLIFKIDSQEYGIDISFVSRIIEMDMAVARVPKTPPYVEGVINLRGDIVPVISLRRRLGYDDCKYDEDTRIIILRNEDISVGLIVDAVVEVALVLPENIEEAAGLTGGLGGLSGLGGVSGLADGITGGSTGGLAGIFSAEDVYGVYKMNGRVVTMLKAERFTGPV